MRGRLDLVLTMKRSFTFERQRKKAQDNRTHQAHEDSQLRALYEAGLPYRMEYSLHSLQQDSSVQPMLLTSGQNDFVTANTDVVIKKALPQSSNFQPVSLSMSPLHQNKQLTMHSSQQKINDLRGALVHPSNQMIKSGENNCSIICYPDFTYQPQTERTSQDFGRSSTFVQQPSFQISTYSTCATPRTPFLSQQFIFMNQPLNQIQQGFN